MVNSVMRTLVLHVAQTTLFKVTRNKAQLWKSERVNKKVKKKLVEK